MRNPFARKPASEPTKMVSANESDLNGQVKYMEGYFAGYQEATKNLTPPEPAQPQLTAEPGHILHTGFYL